MGSTAQPFEPHAWRMSGPAAPDPEGPGAVVRGHGSDEAVGVNRRIDSWMAVLKPSTRAYFAFARNDSAPKKNPRRLAPPGRGCRGDYFFRVYSIFPIRISLPSGPFIVM